jgi:hypothetical protein
MKYELRLITLENSPGVLISASNITEEFVNQIKHIIIKSSKIGKYRNLYLSVTKDQLVIEKAIYDLMGTINKDKFLGFSPKTAMFQGFNAQESISNGERSWVCQYVFYVRLSKSGMQRKILKYNAYEELSFSKLKLTD